MVYSLKNFLLKAMFTLTVFGILLFKVRLVLALAQRGTCTERIKFSVKNQKLFRRLRMFITYLFVLILFNPFSIRKIEKLDF